MIWIAGCQSPATDSASVGDVGLRLRWIPAYDAENAEEARAGLAWTLSLVGGAPPVDGSWFQGEMDAGFTLNLAAAGLNPAVFAVPGDDDVALFGAVDLGRWLLATVYRPETYYRATGACPTRAEWLERFPVDGRFIATQSAIVPDLRRIRFVAGADEPDAVGFEATAVDEAAATPQEVEVVDLLPSGQQRFAIYDANGWLTPSSSDPAVGPPGRCMWCHEGDVMPLILDAPGARGGVTAVDFSAEVAEAQALLDRARVGLDVEVDFDTYAVHEWAERLVQGFLAPPASRVAAEWGVDDAEVARWLADAPTHTDGEYGDDWLRYDRVDVDAALEARLAEEGTTWTPMPGAEAARTYDLTGEEWDLSRFSCD